MKHPQTKKDAAIYQEGSSAPVESMTVSGRVVFDGLGRTIKQYYPTMDTGLVTAFVNSYNTDVDPTETTYDAIDRTTSVELPDDSITNTDYSIGELAGRTYAITTVTDAQGNRKKTYKDARELIMAIKEWASDQAPGTGYDYNELTTRYTYDAMKQITKVIDAKGNETKVSYDNLGRRLTMDNPDMGKVEMRYDLAGNMIEKVTANLRDQNSGEPDVQGSTSAAGAGSAGSAGAAIQYTYDHGVLHDCMTA